MKVSIVIPCYNEEKNIPIILEKFKKIISKEYSFELILVNNGSQDNSMKVLKSNIEKYNFLKIVEVEKNQGYGYGILKGLQVADGDYLGWMHADMQTEPNEFNKCIEYVINENYPKGIFMRGLRKKRPIIDRIFTFGMTIFESIYLGKRMHDINAQPTFFSRELYEECDESPHDFALDLYIYYKAIIYDYKIVRFPVFQNERIYGVSSWNTGMKSRIDQTKKVINYSRLLKKRNNLNKVKKY